MAHQHRLNLGRSEPLAGYLDRVVRSSQHVPEPVLRVDIRPIAVDPHIGKAIPVSLHIAIAIAPEAASHARPRVADHELADLAPHRLALGVDHVRRDPRNWTGERAWPEVRDDVAAQDPARYLGAARVVDH